MDILLEQESNMTTIAALSTIAVSKTDNNHTTANTHVPTDTVKSALEVGDFRDSPLHGAFDNLPPCDPVEIYFRDLSYSVQKMFSKSQYLSVKKCVKTYQQTRMSEKINVLVA